MNILIIGSGGREHALAWRLSQCSSVDALYACPGNPGIEQLARCLPKPSTVAGYANLAVTHAIDLTVVGPEAPLVEGVVDCFQERGLRIIGPTQAAAQLEGSKIFAKQFFEHSGIPTARSVQVTSFSAAQHHMREFGLPVVIKADGLAAGKGVVIATTWDEATEAVNHLGPLLVIEEFLEGEEVSFIGLSDGRTILPFAPAQDHKRVFDGDRGPNTGGMGSYCDTRILTAAQHGEIMDRIMHPAIAHMEAAGTPFTGFLYAGVMLTAQGPKLLEFNVRLGDPETQCLLYSYTGDFAALLDSAASGSLATASTLWGPPSVCVVIAAEGYPGEVVTGAPISGIEEAEATGAVVFQAGTRREGDRLLTAGGRVLGITVGASTLTEAVSGAYTAAAKIQIPGSHYRRDIGQKGLRRW
jgi:phosphoribosylamine---glycine ligase